MGKNIDYFEHECDLPVSVDTFLFELPPYFPRYKRWFFSLRRFFVVDENLKRTKRFFRSYAAVMAEKKRHARGEHSKMIHPLSKFTMWRERFICVLWLASFCRDPIRWSFLTTCRAESLPVTNLLMDCCFLINVVLICFSGYIVPLTKEIVMSPKRIFKAKVFTFIIPEILSSIDFMTIAINGFQIHLRTSRVFIIGAMRFMRYFRLLEMIRYLTNIFQDMNIPESMSTVVVVSLMGFYLVHWISCGLFFSSIAFYTWAGLPNESWLMSISSFDKKELHRVICEGSSNAFVNFYMVVVIRATCHFFGAGDGYQPLTLGMEKLMCTCAAIIGFVYTHYAMAKVLELFGSVYFSESKYEELIYQVSEYIRSKNLPPEVKKRLMMYYEYKFQKKFYKEDVIFANLSEHLRCEVFLHSCRGVLDKVPLLQGMSKGVVGSIIGYLKKEIYLPNDVVLKYGEPLTRLCWVSTGTLAVYYGPDSVEVLHFEDGDHFSDNGILGKRSTAQLSVVALEITEIFTLARKDVRHCTVFLKEIGDKIARISREKGPLYAALGKMMSNFDNQNRVISDLRKGRILERDRYRGKRTNAKSKQHKMFNY